MNTQPSNLLLYLRRFSAMPTPDQHRRHYWQRQMVGVLCEKLANMKHDFGEVLEKQDEFLTHYTRRSDGR